MGVKDAVRRQSLMWAIEIGGSKLYYCTGENSKNTTEEERTDIWQ
jgi:hypothetical protein